jgi:hypothetical protein
MNGDSMQQVSGDYPPAYVPVSGWAVTALVLAIVLAIPALFGVYWPEALPLVLVILSWGSISSRRRRGMGLAIAAGVIALLAGGYGLFTAKLVAAVFQEKIQPLVEGARAGDEAFAGRWLVPGEDAAARAAAWKQRFAAAEERMGKWGGKIEAGSFLAGPLGVIAAPSGVVEVEPVGTGSVGLGEVVWFRAVADRGPIWIAIQGKPGEPGRGLEQMMKSIQHDVKQDSKGLDEPKAIYDLRFFVATGSAAPK